MFIFSSSCFSILKFLKGLTLRCPFTPKILDVSSSLKPFITDITIIRVATPKEIPAKEINVMIEKNFSYVLGKRNL